MKPKKNYVSPKRRFSMGPKCFSNGIVDEILERLALLLAIPWKWLLNPIEKIDNT